MMSWVERGWLTTLEDNCVELTRCRAPCTTSIAAALSVSITVFISTTCYHTGTERSMFGARTFLDYKIKKWHETLAQKNKLTGHEEQETKLGTNLLAWGELGEVGRRRVECGWGGHKFVKRFVGSVLRSVKSLHLVRKLRQISPVS